MPKTVSLLNDEPGDERAPIHLTSSTSEDRTGQQVATLLSVIQQTEKILANVLEPAEQVDFDPEAVKTSRETHALAHYQLRNILDDHSRWSNADDNRDRRFDQMVDADARLLRARAKSEASRQKVLQSQQAAAELSRRTAEEQNRPSRVLQVRIRRARIETGELKWIVWHGSDIPINEGLVGEGNSVAEAMQNFDANYYADIQRKAALEEIQSEVQQSVQKIARAKRKPRKKNDEKSPQA